LPNLKSGDKIDTIEKDIADHKATLASFPAGSQGRADYQKTIDALETKRAARTSAEAPVVKNVQDKRQLNATLQLDKAAIEASKPAAAKNNYAELTDKAKGMIDVFNNATDATGKKVGGNFYKGSHLLGVGENWEADSNLTFDKMVKEFHNDPARLE